MLADSYENCFGMFDAIVYIKIIGVIRDASQELNFIVEYEVLVLIPGSSKSSSLKRLSI